MLGHVAPEHLRDDRELEEDEYEEHDYVLHHKPFVERVLKICQYIYYIT